MTDKAQHTPTQTPLVIRWKGKQTISASREYTYRAVDAHDELLAELQDAQQIMRDAAATIANTKPAMSAELHHAADSANAAIAKAAE